jgi:transcriptional regulator with PAS, ATPase and Fis domain
MSKIEKKYISENILCKEGDCSRCCGDLECPLITYGESAISLPIVLIDTKLDIVCFANDSFQSKFRVFKKDIVGKRIEELGLAIPTEILNALTNEYCTIYQGHYVKVYAKVHSNKVFLTIVDITKEYTYGKNLSEIVDKYKNLISQTQTSFCITDKDGKILEKNDIFDDIVNISDNNVLDAIHNKNISKNWIRLTESTSAKSPLTMEVQIRNKNEELKWFELTCNSFMNGSEFDTVKMICLWKDITENKEKETKLYINKEKNKDAIRQKIISIKNKRKMHNETN